MKRFGRNQRRRAREQINRLQAALDHQESVARGEARMRMEAQTELMDAKKIGHAMSVFAPVGRYKANFPPQHVIDIDNPDKTGGLPARGDDLRNVRLHAILANVKLEALHGVRFIHAHVTFSGGEAAYSITEGAMAVTPPDVLVRILAKELAISLAPQLKRFTQGIYDPLRIEA